MNGGTDKLGLRSFIAPSVVFAKVAMIKGDRERKRDIEIAGCSRRRATSQMAKEVRSSEPRVTRAETRISFRTLLPVS